MRVHNRCAVAARYSMREVTHTFAAALDWLEGSSAPEQPEEGG